ncbi:MAG: polyprenyl synthetase family protein [Candidatus Cloacimonetes bacterium]|nr:polyprenyl synthetase family protein [Candidatus Cloacimonadota bacterium]MDY0336901.1 polyprenyl synthetase family protein [Candidatus Cloacimonadaceae bacterium]MCB5268594.1 polyprenyl synthetase family protein [Candidatus Cloacimonadota bacterium]MCK9334397.1 polyprenyl synthetase family protein [Candidatus Cloacimonadota bacterium]MDD2543412.1 polyprenyl synthetase family protein [Candidatus Cloacimonadota bacterium]
MLLQKYFESRMQMIEDGLAQALEFDKRHAVTLKEAMRKAVIPGGKRWRPLLLISIYEMLTGLKKNNKQLPDAIHAACAVELIHNAAMIHEDMPSVMNHKERRGLPATHQEYGNVVAILAADALYSLAFEQLGQIKDAKKGAEAIRSLAINTKSYGLIGGQAIDLANKRKVMKINTLRYIDMKKVGSLLQACADLACILAGADENTRQIMSSYAVNLGMAYQMIDDIEADYARGSEGLDFSEDYVPVSKASYTGLMGFDKARRQVESLLDECSRSIKPFPNNDVLTEFIQMISERLP